MSSQPPTTATRLKNITTSLTVIIDTIEAIAAALNVPFLDAITATTRSLLENTKVNSVLELGLSSVSGASLDCKAKQE
jgi:hypothetical protein